MKNKRLTIGTLIRNNKFVMAISLLTAITIWLIVTFSVEPTTKESIDNVKVKIDTNSQALQTLGLDVIGEKDALTVTVTVICKRYQKDLIKNSDIIATANLSAVSAPGEYSVDIAATKSDNSKFDFTIDKVTPAKINISFDRFRKLQLKLSAKAIGAAAPEGLTVEKATLIDSANSTLDIEGPESIINRIESAEAVATVNSTLSETSAFPGDVVLYDAAGTKIPADNLKLSFTRAQVSIPISRRKELPILPVFVNAPDAYKNQPIPHILTNDKVTVSGPPDVVDSMTSIPLSPIDFGTITPSNYRFLCDFNPPVGVKVNDEIGQVRVSVNNKNLRSKTLEITKFSFVGKPAGLNAEVTTKLTGVTVAGNRNSISEINANNVFAELDLSEFPGAGSYQVPAKIKFNSHNDVWPVNHSSGQYTVYVKIY